MITFSVFLPHAPILLPGIGSAKEKKELKKTMEALELIQKKRKDLSFDLIIISSPHRDWGIKVPLFFFLKPEERKKFSLVPYQEIKNFSSLKREKNIIYPFLTDDSSPENHFVLGKKMGEFLEKEFKEYKIALVGSGDLSHCLKPEGPYGFQEDGPKFDNDFLDFLEKGHTEKILKLNQTYPLAGECGLRSFCFILGILKGVKKQYLPEILSYQGPFGVGYLVSHLKIL